MTWSCRDLQEVPYETRVQPISFKQLRSGDWRIEQDVLVPSEEVGGKAKRLLDGAHLYG